MFPPFLLIAVNAPRVSKKITLATASQLSKVFEKMTLLKDISESHDFLKAILIPLLLIPFWCFSIYLFGYEFYENSDIFIKISFCFMNSFISSILMFICFHIGQKDKKDNNLLINVSSAVFLLLLWKSALMFIMYTLGFLFDMYIYYYFYIIIYFIPIFLIMVYEKNQTLKE